MKIVVFGAGQVALSMLPLLAQKHDILALVDNDAAKHGTELAGYQVYPPAALRQLAPDGIVIGCLRQHHDAIVRQVGELGLGSRIVEALDAEVIDFIERDRRCDNEIPGTGLVDALVQARDMKGSVFYDVTLANKLIRLASRYLAAGAKTGFHAGVSRSLGMEIYSAVVAGWSWLSVEPYPCFTHDYPFARHLAVIRKLVDALLPVTSVAVPLSASETLAADGVPGWRLGPAAIRYYPGETLESAPLATASCDLGISWAVMEHVVDVPSFVEKCFQLLVPGGICVHGIDLRDHIDFSKPLDHLCYDEQGWHKRLQYYPGYYCNRLRLSDFRQIFVSAGFEILEENVYQTNDPDYVEGIRSRLNGDYRHLVDEDLYVAGIEFVLRKPQ